MKKCKCEWCDNEVKRTEYCNRHQQQIKRWGEVRFSRGDKNQYIINNEENYAEIILYDKNLNEKARAIIDIEDLERCKPYKWTLRNDGYVSTKKNYKGIKLHRFIANTPEGMHTDHINRNRLDNRKDNLRICSQQENNKNKGLYSVNKTGHRGIEVREMTTKTVYLSVIRFEGKSHHLGSFDNIDDAIKAREQAELKFYGYLLDEQ